MDIHGDLPTAMPTNPASRYVLYARKSSEGEDRQAASLEDQHDVLLRLAAERSLEIVKVFSESMSAKAPGRKIFAEMLTYIHANHITGIITWKLNRLFRNPVDEGVMRWMLQNGEIEEIVTPGKTYREADNDFLMAVEGAQAQRFIKDLTMDSMRGVQKKIDAGHAPTLAPVGYRNTIDRPQGQRVIVPDPIQFPIMREVFTMVLSGNYPLQTIYDKAMALGLTTSRGQRLKRTRFYMLVQNPVFYTGRFIYRGIIHQGSHERMISDSEYDLIRSLFSPKAKPRTEDTTRAYNGILRCSCGNWLTGERHIKRYKSGKTQTFTYYRCVHCRNGKPSLISVPSLEEQIVSYLSKISIRQHYVDLFIEWLNGRNTEQRKLREALAEQYRRDSVNAGIKMGNLLELYISPQNKDKSMLSDEEYQTRKTSLVMERQQATERLSTVDKQIDDWRDIIEQTFRFATSAVERFTTGTSEDRRVIVRAFGSNLTVNGKKLDIAIRTPFELLNGYMGDISMFEPERKIDMTGQTTSPTPSNTLWGG